MLHSPNLVSQLGGATSGDDGVFSVGERQERLSILFMGLLVDTFAAVAKGAEFMVDDLGFPDLAYVGGELVESSMGGGGGGVSLSGQQGAVLRMLRRVVVPCLAKNTIWEGTVFAPMYGMCLLFCRLVVLYP